MNFRKWVIAGLFLAVGAGVAWSQGTSVNPPVGSVWTYLGATYGAGWVLPSLSSFLNLPISPLLPPFNCVGDGAHDDTVCMQAAMDATQGNTIYLGPHIYAINSTGLTCHSLMHMVGTQAGQKTDYVTASGFRPLAVNTTILKIPTDVCNGSHFEHFSLDMGAAGANTAGAAISMNASTGINNIIFSDISINRACIGVDMNGNNVKLDRIDITQLSGAGCGGIRVGHYTSQGATVDPTISNSTVQGCGASWFPCKVGGVTTPADFGMRIEDSGGLQLFRNDIIATNNGTVVFPSGGQMVNWTYCTDSVFGDTTVGSPLVIETGTPTNNVNAGVLSFFAQNCWAAAYLSTANVPGILIKNTGSASNFSGFHFSGLRLDSVPSNGIVVAGSPNYGTITASLASQLLTVTATSAPIIIGSLLTGAGFTGPVIVGPQQSGAVQGGVGTYATNTAFGLAVASQTMNLIGPSPTDFSLDGGSVVCGVGAQFPTLGPANAGVEIGYGVYNFAVRNSTIKGQCAGSSNGRMDNAIVFDGNNWGIIITGNDLGGWYSGQAVAGEPIQPDAQIISNPTVIANNKGVDDATRAFTAAAAVDFGVYRQVAISGATPITVLNGCWAGAKVSILPNGGVNFAAGGNITGGNLPYTPTSNVFVEGHAVQNTPGLYPECKWYLR